MRINWNVIIKIGEVILKAVKAIARIAMRVI